MGAQPEIHSDPTQSVAWISRDHVANVTQNPGYEPHSDSPVRENSGRRKWVLAVVILAVLVAGFLLVRHQRGTAPTAGGTTANSIPVVTVTTPGSSAVTAR